MGGTYLGCADLVEGYEGEGLRHQTRGYILFRDGKWD